MTLTELAAQYYGNQKKNCAEAILLASNDYYGLGLTQEDALLLVGFGGGIGCGRICGCLAGAVAVLGKLFAARPDFRNLCAGFVTAFETEMGCGSGNCADITPKYKTPETRCLAAVEKAAGILDAYIAANR